MKTKLNTNGLSTVLTVLVIVVIAAVGGAGYTVANHHTDTKAPAKTSAVNKTTSKKQVVKKPAAPVQIAPATVVTNFLANYKAGKASEVDAAVSANVLAEMHAQFGTTAGGYYELCHSSSDCDVVFSSLKLSGTAPTESAYKAQDGTVGKSLAYTATGTIGSATSTKTYTFSLIPKGNTWLLDDFQLNSSGSANAGN